MAVATFDTLKFANTLKAAGVPDKQAEAQAVAFAEVIQINFRDLATKEDVALIRADIDRVAKELRAEIDRIAKELRAEIGRVGGAGKDDLDRAVVGLKRDIADLRAELKHDIAELRTELKHEIAELRKEFKHELQTMQAKNQADMLLLKWMFGATFSGLVAVIGLLARFLLTQPR